MINQNRLLIISTSSLVVIDQVIKQVLLQTAILPIWYNPGVSFSLRIGGALQTALIACCLLLMATYLYFAIRNSQTMHKKWLLGAFVFIVGGGTGNLLDRLWHNGRVIDYIAILQFPVFNFADVCISIGVGMLLVFFWKEETQTEKGVPDGK